MVDLRLTHFKSARVWFDRGELNLKPVGEVAERIVPCPTTAEVGGGFVAAEFCHCVGRYHYGLLGAKFRPSGNSEMSVQVRIGGSGEPVAWSLASRVDHVCSGLPKEYAKAVLDAGVDRETLRLLGSGSLHFDTAASGMYWSSSLQFQRLARLVIRLLAEGPAIQGDEAALRHLVEEYMRLPKP